MTIFDTIQKWLNKAIDTAEDADSLDTFIHDPTPEKHTVKALYALRTLAERLAGGTSLDTLFAHARTCAVDVRADADLRAWFVDFFANVRKSLDEPAYVRSATARHTRTELRDRWRALLAADSDAGRKWKGDVATLKRELRSVAASVRTDADLKRLREAHAQLGLDIEGAAGEAGAVGLQAAMDQVSWFWQDLFKVYVPRMLGVLKDIPIPRYVLPQRYLAVYV